MSLAAFFALGRAVPMGLLKIARVDRTPSSSIRLYIGCRGLASIENLVASRGTIKITLAQTGIFTYSYFKDGFVGSLSVGGNY